MSGYAKVRLTSRSALRHIVGPQGLLLSIRLINLAPHASVCRQKAEQGWERGGLPLAHWPPALARVGLDQQIHQPQVCDQQQPPK